VLHRVLGPEAARAGGLLRVGLYNPSIDVDDLAGRVEALLRSLRADSALRNLYQFDTASYAALEQALGELKSLRAPDTNLSRLAVHPKLHFKGFLYISREPWKYLISGPPMADGMRVYLEELIRQREQGVREGEEDMAQVLQQVGAKVINPIIGRMPEVEWKRWAFLLAVGSANQDYRSMTMDGEATILVTNWTALYAVSDFILLTGLVDWVDDQAALDRGLPPPSGFKRWLACWIKMAL
jgi:hypothetical protein